MDQLHFIMGRTVPKSIFLWAGILGYLFLIALTLWHRQPPLFDEPYFVANAQQFEKEGLTRDFLYNMKDQAPGPLYEFTHTIFRPFTNLETPGIRLVNVFLLGLLSLMMAGILVMIRKMSFFEGLIYSAPIIAVPMVWQVSGMALTEMPAMFCAVAAVFLLLIALQKEETAPIASTILSFLAGLMLGLSILGRSPFLLLIPACLTWFAHNLGNLRRWRTLAVLTLTALAVCVPVFFIWHGLVPPEQAFVGQGFSIWHGVLAFAYTGLMAIFVAPRWFIINVNVIIALIVGYLVLLVFNIYISQSIYAPLDAIMSKLLSKPLLDIFHLMISPLLALMAIYFTVCAAIRAWERRGDMIFLFLMACGFALLVSSGKVTHLFSTRYVAQAAPFFLLIFIDFDRSTRGRLLRFCLGMVIGFLSLETYFNFH